MTSIFNRFTELDPALEAAQIEAKVGSPVFDKYSFLDEARFNAQAAAALGGTLDLPALLDPVRARVEFEAMAAGGGGGGYVAKAVHFDGSTWLRADALLGVSDTPLLSSSHWLKAPTEDTTYLLFDFNPATTEAPCLLIETSTGSITFFSWNGTDFFGWITAAGSYPSDGDWHNILFAANLNHVSLLDMIVQIYVDDAPVTVSPITSKVGPCISVVSSIPFAIPDTTEDTDVIVADIADTWVAPGSFMDWTVEVNRRKFISAAKKPVDPSGFPVGAVLLSGDADTFGTNQGTGGVFTLTGTLTNTTTSPSD